jgi:hypothetical protein
LNVEDVDGDGFTTCDGDCDDDDGTLSLDDLDGDGFSTCDGDCDDGDLFTYPGAASEDSLTACMRDFDGDNYGDDSPSNSDVTAGTDCNDLNSAKNPGGSPPNHCP